MPIVRSAPRAGVSLIEVLVATVILGIGIAGAQSAMLAAARYRAAADAREALAALMVEQMLWFERRGCAGADSSDVLEGARGARVAWGLRRDSAGVQVWLEGRVRIGSREHRLQVAEGLPCA